MIWYDTILYFLILYNIKWYDMIWPDMTLYDIMWYDMLGSNISWYDIIWYDFLLYDLIWYDKQDWRFGSPKVEQNILFICLRFNRKSASNLLFLFIVLHKSESLIIEDLF